MLMLDAAAAAALRRDVSRYGYGSVEGKFQLMQMPASHGRAIGSFLDEVISAKSESCYQ